ncbi:heavy metal-binding domain-containing protein [Aequorivita lipolytica]|uniref:Heavy metal-binding domain-containing protein n=2 Tax=Aequorivita lipolytica TaxID=153267 RepID=A0A5C6YU30_9FLAO|nr:heavy metal-binding domain-containing protein [Aequorivita lipolytica]
MQTAIINEYKEPKSDGYCSKCGKELYEKYSNQILFERRNIINELERLIILIPVISIHTPLNWDYEIIGMVTGQSTTGTGVITEFTSSFTDFFGAQSGRHNRKLKEGEDMCFIQLRKQALDLGANAVIATDIDYSEVGAGKGMLMVCMSGTAVKLNNIDVIGKGKGQLLQKLTEANDRFKFLSGYQTIHD